MNLGAGKEISIGDLAELISDVTGFEGRIVWDRRSRTASLAEASTRHVPASSSASRRRRRCEKGSSAQSPGTAPPSPVSVASTSLVAAHGVGRTVDRLLERPRTVLGTLIGAQIVATLVLALSVDHNGWVYFQGGDQIWLATQGWLLGQLELAPTELGYLWSFLLAPIMSVTGPTWVQALPPLVVFQVLVLGPVALLCVYGIASKIGGRLLGYWASLLWVVTPFAAIPLFVDRYQERWAEHFLPQALGLTAMADFPSTVLVLAAAFFVVRSLSPGHLTDAVFAGVLLGAAGALKPPNLLVAFGIALAYVVARRWKEVPRCAGATVPALIVLLMWKYRGPRRGAAHRARAGAAGCGPGPLGWTSTSIATSTSTSITGSSRWISCASSSSARASRSGPCSRAWSRCSAYAVARSRHCSAAGSAPSSSSRASRRGRASRRTPSGG